MAKSQTFRFAFGTENKPGSNVWRLIISKKGDVFLNNAPQVGEEIHVALHASGKFHLKLGNGNYEKLNGPWESDSGLIFGPIIMFYQWDRIIPVPKATGKIKLIEWLGWPDKNHLYNVILNYSQPNLEVLPHPNEVSIGSIYKVKLFHEDMDLHIFLQHKEMSQDELKAVKKFVEKPLDFGNGNIPGQMDMIRVTNTDPRFSLIIHESFEIKK